MYFKLLLVPNDICYIATCLNIMIIKSYYYFEKCINIVLDTDKENYRAYFYIKNLCVTLVISIVWGTLLMSVQSWQWTKTKSKKASNLMVYKNMTKN